jgi:fermentation-respiration switch protein FrsA (DUF1100 family)
MPMVTAPTLVVHGDADTFLPYRFGEALYTASRAPIKRFVRVRGADHTEIPDVLGSAAYATLFLRFAQSPSSSGPGVLP